MTQECTQNDRDQIRGVAPTPLNENGASEKSRQVQMTAVGLHIPQRFSFDEWQLAGEQLSGIVNSSSWCLGDWLVYGKQNYVDRYEHGVQAAGLQYQTLRNYAWVARRFDISRRRPRLSFQHHAEVASLPVDQQDRLLDLADSQSWSTKQLRREVQRLVSPTSIKTAPQARRIVLPEDRLQRWRLAAADAGIDLDDWVLTTLDRAADQIASKSEIRSA